MERFWKKICSMLLVLSICLTVPAAGVYAAEKDTEGNVVSGTCGENIVWEYNSETKEVVISGDGVLDGLRGPEGELAEALNAALSITISDGITSIGDYVFWQFSNLVNVKMADSVTYIGEAAFSWCENLQSVELSKNLKEIDTKAFEACRNLTSIYLPDGILKIGNYAFSNCESLTSIEIPDSVTEIGVGTFTDCIKLKEIIVGAENAKYCSVGGVLFDKERKLLLCYPVNKSGNIYIVPDTVQCIEGNAFRSCRNLSFVKIPDGVTDIRDSAFWWCYNLSGIELPSSLENIGYCAFVNCWNLTNVCFEGTEEEWNIISIASENQELVSANILYSAENLQKDFFEYNGIYCWKTADDSITITGCSPEIEELIVPSQINGMSVRRIGSYAFFAASDLKSVVLSEGIESIGTEAFRDCASLQNIEIPVSVTNIEKSAFLDCFSLGSIKLPEGIETIQQETFRACISLSRAELPSSLKDIGYRAFLDCIDLKHVYFQGEEERWNQIRIDDENDELNSANIHYGMKMPDELEDDKGNEDDNDNSILEYKIVDGTIKIVGCDRDVTGVDIPEQIDGIPVTAIGPQCFAFNDQLKSVSIPDSISEIDVAIFLCCTSLEEVKLSNNLTSIPGGTFSNCTSLKRISLSDGILDIGSGAFERCDSLTDIYFSGTEEQWNNIAIYDSRNDVLKTVTIHYNSQTTQIQKGYISDDLAWVYDENTGTISISGNMPSQSAVYAASFDGDRKYITSGILKESGSSVTVDDGADYIKLFLLDENQRPESPNVEILGSDMYCEGRFVLTRDGYRIGHKVV